MTGAALYLTCAYLLYTMAYAVRDVLWLRALSLIGALLLIPYYAFQSRVLIEPLGWNIFFAALNAFWIVKLAIERWPIQLTARESQLRLIAFPSLSAREARNLFRQGRLEDIAAGVSIVRHDAEENRLSVVLSGEADVLRGGVKVGELGPGQFVGPIDRAGAQLKLDVVVRRQAQVMCWQSEVMRRFLAGRPDVALALERSIGFELRDLLNNHASV